MDFIKKLEDSGAKLNFKQDVIEANFNEKTGFIKHKFELNNLNIKFDEERKIFKIKDLSETEIEKLCKILDKKTTIVFDMDGVIVNTTGSFSVATSKTYNHFTNKELTSKEINEIKYQGGFNSDWDILMNLFKAEGFDIKYEDMTKYYMQLYFDGKNGLINDETLILEEKYILELLENYNLSIFTGRDTQTAIYTLNRWNLEKYFYPIITFECVGIDHQKPDTKGVSLIKEQVIADKIYYLGDTVDDMSCARNSNVNGIGVLPPRDKSDILKNRLLEEGAITCLNVTTDLAKFLQTQKALV